MEFEELSALKEIKLKDEDRNTLLKDSLEFIANQKSGKYKTVYHNNRLRLLTSAIALIIIASVLTISIFAVVLIYRSFNYISDLGYWEYEEGEIYTIPEISETADGIIEYAARTITGTASEFKMIIYLKSEYKDEVLYSDGYTALFSDGSTLLLKQVSETGSSALNDYSIRVGTYAAESFPDEDSFTIINNETGTETEITLAVPDIHTNIEWPKSNGLTVKVMQLTKGSRFVTAVVIPEDSWMNKIMATDTIPLFYLGITAYDSEGNSYNSGGLNGYTKHTETADGVVINTRQIYCLNDYSGEEIVSFIISGVTAQFGVDTDDKVLLLNAPKEGKKISYIKNNTIKIGDIYSMSILSAEWKDDEFIICTNNTAFPNIAFSDGHVISGGLTKLVADEDANLSMIYMSIGQISESCTVDFWKNEREDNGSGDYKYYKLSTSYDWLNNAEIVKVDKGKMAVFISSIQYNIKGS